MSTNGAVTQHCTATGGGAIDEMNLLGSKGTRSNGKTFLEKLGCMNHTNNLILLLQSVVKSLT